MRFFKGFACLSILLLAIFVAGCDKPQIVVPLPPVPGDTSGVFVPFFGDTVALAAHQWTEIPASPVHMPEGYSMLTHYTEVNGRRLRNYTMLYDHTYKVSHWVAYPLHNVYRGSAGRQDEWVYDPSLSQSLQMDVVSGGYLKVYGIRGYDRGHQIPSADRQATVEMNQQTFYPTNCTPQNAQLNQNLWANLEALVRTQICSDTVFVITGCAITTAEDKTVDWIWKNNVRVGAIPKAYWKVMLRTKNGRTGALPNDGTAKCIGFWMENSTPDTDKVSRDFVKSVTEIEKLTGFEFFTGISDNVKSRYNLDLWGL